MKRKTIDYRLQGMRIEQWIINTMNMLLNYEGTEDNFQSVTMPIGKAEGEGQGFIINITIEPDLESWAGSTLDIPYKDRDELLGKLPDPIRLKIGQK